MNRQLLLLYYRTFMHSDEKLKNAKNIVAVYNPRICLTYNSIVVDLALDLLISYNCSYLHVSLSVQCMYISVYFQLSFIQLFLQRATVQGHHMSGYVASSVSCVALFIILFSCMRFSISALVTQFTQHTIK